MKAQRFSAKIWRPEGAGTSYFVTLPSVVVKIWGTRARVAVKGTVNGFAFRSSAMPYGGKHLLAINAQMREGAGGVDVGDSVELVLEQDLAPRVVDPPAELAPLLAKSRAAKRVWDALPPSHRREYAGSIAEARQAATRERRAAKAIELLLAKGRMKG